jgi:hypothetical protein
MFSETVLLRIARWRDLDSFMEKEERDLESKQ